MLNLTAFNFLMAPLAKIIVLFATFLALLVALITLIFKKENKVSHNKTELDSVIPVFTATSTPNSTEHATDSMLPDAAHNHEQANHTEDIMVTSEQLGTDLVLNINDFIIYVKTNTSSSLIPLPIKYYAQIAKNTPKLMPILALSLGAQNDITYKYNDADQLNPQLIKLLFSTDQLSGSQLPNSLRNLFNSPLFGSLIKVFQEDSTGFCNLLVANTSITGNQIKNIINLGVYLLLAVVPIIYKLQMQQNRKLDYFSLEEILSSLPTYDIKYFLNTHNYKIYWGLNTSNLTKIPIVEYAKIIQAHPDLDLIIFFATSFGAYHKIKYDKDQELNSLLVSFQQDSQNLQSVEFINKFEKLYTSSLNPTLLQSLIDLLINYNNTDNTGFCKAISDLITKETKQRFTTKYKEHLEEMRIQVITAIVSDILLSLVPMLNQLRETKKQKYVDVETEKLLNLQPINDTQQPT
jgi:hypothetical protein